MPTDDYLTAPMAPTVNPRFAERMRREDLKERLRRHGRLDTEADLAIEAELWAEISIESGLPMYKPGLGASTIDGRPWAIDGLLIDSAMTLMAGKFKNGKSTLATELAVSLSTGTPMFGLDEFPMLVEPSRVLILQTENSDVRVDRDITAILAARGLGPTEHGIMVISHPKPPAHRFNLLSSGHFARLLDLIKSGGYRYVVLDPIYQLIGDVNMTTWDNGPAITERLTQLRDAGCTPIITSALRASGDFGFDSVLGATIFAGWMESGILVQRYANERDFKVKVDVTRDRDTNGRATYELTGNGIGRWEMKRSTASAANTETAEHAPAEPTSYHRQLDYLASHPNASIEEIAKAIGVTVRQVRRNMKKPA